MAQDNDSNDNDSNEGVTYLRALKQMGGSAAAAAAAPAPDHALEEHSGASTTIENSSEQQYKGAEKRRSRRYKCEGSAELRAENCEVRTWASNSAMIRMGYRAADGDATPYQCMLAAAPADDSPRWR